MTHHVIVIHALAPAKPAPNHACNGCGVCCLSEPCPLGILVSGRFSGACRALSWNDGQRRYECTLLSAPPAAAGATRRWVASLRRRLVGRWIAAGRGCDSDAALLG